jgi:large subunit ribosomal protein L44
MTQSLTIPKPETPTRPGVLHADALSSVPRALTALVYTHRSLPTARKFAHAFFLGRDVDLRAMLKFTDPKKALADTVRKLGRERPVSRFVLSGACTRTRLADRLP